MSTSGAPKNQAPNKESHPIHKIQELLGSALRQFASKGLKTIVPTVYGQTQESAKKQGNTSTRWDEASLFDKLARTVGAKELELGKQIYNWMRKGGKREVVFGRGSANGSVYPLFKPDGVSINPLYLSSDGKLWFQFGGLNNKPIFGSIEARRALMERFNTISGVKFTDADLNSFRGIPLAVIANDPEGSTKVLAALAWMEKQIETS